MDLSFLLWTIVGLAAMPSIHACDLPTTEFLGQTADELQHELMLRSGTRCCVRLPPSFQLNCGVREDIVAGEKSTHALLIPEGVELDLNDGALLLDLRSNSYGVRLCTGATVRNGTIKVIHSEGKGSQACWHSAISVGAAYGDGGTPENPGHFVTVSHWKIESVTIDQQVEAAAIQLMSDACHGVIRDVTIEDSKLALLGIGMDWGCVGPMTSEDALLPRMKMLWASKQIYTTHPHDILLENVRVGRLGRNKDANDAGVRCSACHRITIRNVEIESAACAIAIWGGDCGYEYARADLQQDAHSGYIIDDITIHDAQRYGLVLNGTADNILRAQANHDYEPIHDPVHPGINGLRVSNMHAVGSENVGSQGIYAVAVSGAELTNMQIRKFAVGIHAEDWVNGMSFRNSQMDNNGRDILLEGTKEPATGVTFE